MLYLLGYMPWNLFKNWCGDYSNLTTTHCLQNAIFTIDCEFSHMRRLFEMQRSKSKHSKPSFWSSSFKMLKVEDFNNMLITLAFHYLWINAGCIELNHLQCIRIRQCGLRRSRNLSYNLFHL